MVNSNAFAKRIEEILTFYGISATAFAQAIDFNRSTISHILSGRNKPSLEFVLKIVNTYPEVELYWLLNGKGSFPTPEESKLPISKEIKDKLEVVTEQKYTSAIDRIVIFYKDGSFKEYLP